MVQIAFRHMIIARIRESSNTAVKNAPFSRWTAQKRAAFYLGRYAFKKMTALYLVLTKEKPWSFLLS